MAPELLCAPQYPMDTAAICSASLHATPVPDPPQSGGERGRARLHGDREVVVVEQGEDASVGRGVAKPRQGSLEGCFSCSEKW